MGGGPAAWVLSGIMALLALSTLGFTVAVAWEAINGFRDRRAFRLAIRKLKVAHDGKQDEATGPGTGPGVWDRELDG